MRRLIISLFILCAVSPVFSQQAAPIAAKPLDAIAAYFNGMTKENALAAFAEFCPDAVFHLPPNDFIVFSKDKKIRHKYQIGSKTNYGIIGSWNYADRKFTVSISNKKTVGELFDKENYSFTALTAEYSGSSSPKTIDFTFNGSFIMVYMKEEQKR